MTQFHIPALPGTNHKCGTIFIKCGAKKCAQLIKIVAFFLTCTVYPSTRTVYLSNLFQKLDFLTRSHLLALSNLFSSSDNTNDNIMVWIEASHMTTAQHPTVTMVLSHDGHMMFCSYRSIVHLSVTLRPLSEPSALLS